VVEHGGRARFLLSHRQSGRDGPQRTRVRASSAMPSPPPAHAIRGRATRSPTGHVLMAPGAGPFAGKSCRKTCFATICSPSLRSTGAPPRDACRAAAGALTTRAVGSIIRLISKALFSVDRQRGWRSTWLEVVNPEAAD
jgi:hypothetical protein